MEDLIICCAPVPGERQSERFPGTLDTAAESIAAVKAGASIVHLHVRDKDLLQTTDVSLFSSDVDKIKKETGAIIEGSTGGAPEHTLDDRCVSFSVPGIEMGSLNVGSVNMYDDVYKNGIDDVRFYTGKLKQNGLKPFICIFDLSHLCTVKQLEDEGLLEGPYVFNFVFDVPASLPYEDRYLEFFLKEIPDGSHWFLTRHHVNGAEGCRFAMENGGHIRVGYEDGPFVTGGKRGGTNAALVEDIAEAAQKAGRPVAEPDKTRNILGI